MKRRGGSRSSPRKASDWSGNQRASFIVQKQQSIRKEPYFKKDKDERIWHVITKHFSRTMNKSIPVKTTKRLIIIAINNDALT
ncbi:hypothetical protein J7I93_10980, partial [Bacillus sp. ISL-47]|uniref:hypothetical protein n=1 Tax=Bacillus sp. ISL-47 TaxID=2819130 RepID=UPI001BE6360D